MRDDIYDILRKPAPCDGCIHAQDCKAESLACGVFAKYVNRGQIDNEKRRLPTRARFIAIFGAADGLRGRPKAPRSPAKE